VRGATFAQARIWLPLYLLLAVASGFVDLRMRRFPELGMTKYTPEVVSGIAEAPGRYRVLMPFALDGTVRATGADPMTIWHLSRLIGFFASWVVLHAYLRTWFPLHAAIAGTLLVAATLPLTFTNSWAHPDHIPELALFTLGCFAIARGRDALFAITLVVATLNRETAAFLVALYLVGDEMTRTRLVKTAGFAAVWAAIYVGLRVARGFVAYDPWQLVRNLEFLKLLPAPYDPYARAYAWFGVILFGPLLYLAVQRRGNLPRFVRGALWVVPLVVVTCVLFSSIVESRIFTPIFPLIVPAVMFTVLQPKDSTDHSSPASA
jgi:hypothetical protein